MFSVRLLLAVFICFVSETLCTNPPGVCGRRPASLEPTTTAANLYEARPGQWPWHAAFYIVNGGVFQYHCSGTLIDNNVVLTAAHCVNRYDDKVFPAADVRVGLGKTRSGLNEQEERIYKVKRIVRQPSELKVDITDYTDIDELAVIILDGTVEITDKIMPICSPHKHTNNQNISGKIGWITHWFYGRGGNDADKLRMAPMPVLPVSECPMTMADYSDEKRKLLLDGHFCAGHFNSTVFKKPYVCEPHKGFGIYFQNPATNRWHLEGIYTFAPQETFDCQTWIFYFKRVANYAQWISRAIRGVE